MPDHLATEDPLEALARLERLAKRAQHAIATGSAKNGTSALAKIEKMAADSRRYALEAREHEISKEQG